MSIYLGNTPLAHNAVSRNIGEIIQSTIPLSDAGLHLLDGSLINGAGSYAKFVNYIAGLVSNYPDLFVSESDWQSAVTTYGVCGKFVYDSTNNTVRLPKITGFTEGTTDVTALGDLVEAGLPNITGEFFGESGLIYGSGAFSSGNHPYRGATSGSTNNQIFFDASRSSSIYGNSTTVQPQAIKVLYYIVIANSVKTNIEVDIDEIATDLNGKADVDLSNCTKPHIVETYVNGTSWYRVYSDGWCEQGGRAAKTVGDEGLQTINLIKSYTNTNYSIVITSSYASGGADNAVCTINSSTIADSSFQIVPHWGSAAGYLYWRVCGYIS